MAGMVVQHNMNAMNANNKLSMNVIGTKKSTEKLSSGLQINRAGDNAAGLAISEKMRAQIRGLHQAINNSNDGISLIQTAEGGLNESHAILQRMRELAVQSANGTYQDFDRDAIQLEVDRLKDELDRISASTEYNKIKLLDGSLSGIAAGTTEYGPRYGVYLTSVIDPTDTDFAAYQAAGVQGLLNVSLDGSVIASNVAGINVAMNGGASGIGGENAEWSADGTTLTFHLVEGQSYTQMQINDLIKKAGVMKPDATGAVATAAPADVSITLKNGLFTFSEAETFATVTGRRASAAGALTPFLMTGGTVATDKYANNIEFTANNYGVDERTITIFTDSAAGAEEVKRVASNDESKGIKNGAFELHLATGVEYSAEAIQQLLAKAGLDYTVKLSNIDAAGAVTSPDGDITFYANTSLSGAGNGVTYTMGGTAAGGDGVAGTGVGADKSLSTGKGLTFQIGANGVADQRVTLNVDNMSSVALGVRGADVSKQDSANAAIEIIDRAVNTVSMQRAALGALQNRLEYTVNNLTVTEENLTAAESQIRDTDMATEMVNYTKYSILQQAAQAMLAQANQAPQAVLQLLR